MAALTLNFIPKPGQRVEEGGDYIKYPFYRRTICYCQFLDDNDDRQHQRVCLHAKILVPKYG